MVRAIVAVIKSDFLKFRQKISVKLNLGKSIQFQDFKIELPSNHLLPHFQSTFLKYDKFLPHLVKHFEDGGCVIDVGANVGDSLAAMVSVNSSLHYVCIEPDSHFFNYLKKNAELMKKAYPELRIDLIQEFVGKELSTVHLEGSGGTKHAVSDPTGPIISRELDAILAEISNLEVVRLLKSDVDGFDYDVLNSARAIIKRHLPMIYFECQYDFQYQKESFAKCIVQLEASGYTFWTLFDNFGERLLQTQDSGIILQLLDYVWNQNIGNATRTIYYFDILVCQEKDLSFAKSVISSY
jgi:FkbM family methyltransferase